MKLQRVSEHVYFVQGMAGIATDNAGFVSNAGVVFTGEGIVLFDALGTPSLAHKLLGLIRGISSAPLRYVVLSHYHADHVYGLQVFEEAGARILAPAGAEHYLRSEGAAERLEERRLSLAPWVNDETRLVEPDEYVDVPRTLELGDVRLVLTPVGAAHSDGDLTLYVEPDRVLFSGDIIFEGRIPFMGDANSRHWLEVLEHMESRRLAAMIPGHGALAVDPGRAISDMRRYLSYLREQMGAAVEEMIPFEEIYDQIDWSAWQDMPAFREANRRNALQVYLSMEGEQFE
ncbi:MAG TPA: MBL fold metallo-hydrolase [Gammaproteobacteria bacterium]|nr:MBL fold metallo-hydrolase [Gammaproteobacteria bacterium]